MPDTPLSAPSDALHRRLLSVLTLRLNQLYSQDGRGSEGRLRQMQLLGFRAFRDRSTIPLEQTTCVICRNNGGKTTLLEAVRLSTPHSLLQFLLDKKERRGGDGLTSGMNFIFSKGNDNYHYPHACDLGFRIGDRIISLRLSRRGRWVTIEWFKDQSRVCTLALDSHFQKGRFYWGADRPARLDGRSLIHALVSPAIKEDFDRLTTMLGSMPRVSYHNCARDDHRLLDDLEKEIFAQIAANRITPLLNKICSFFGLLPLFWLPIHVSSAPILPTPRELRSREATATQLRSLSELLRDFRRRTGTTKVTGEVLTFTNALADEYQLDNYNPEQSTFHCQSIRGAYATTP